jgi:hypothetical protein
MKRREDYDLSIANRALSYDSPRLYPFGRVLYLLLNDIRGLMDDMIAMLDV